jgi:APA family basic amino acid/polyamine antiporter
MIVSIIIATFMYAMALIVQTGLMPWQELKHSEIPFATGLMKATGKPYLGTVLLIAACFNIIGVYSGMFYGATRALYSLGKFGLIPEIFSKIHPKYNTPYVSIIFISCLIGVTPFIGEWAFQPLVNIAAFLYIVLWGSTVLAVTKLRKNVQNNNLSKPYWSKIKSILGIIVIIFMILSMLIPQSPGALAWPSEYILLAVLIILGIVLYGLKNLKHNNEKA